LAKGKEGEDGLTLTGTAKTGETRISGTVRDLRGRPVAGIYVSAYRDSMMISKPDYISRVTGPDGSYVVDLAEGGEYYIGARNTLGGPAEKGDLLGKYSGDEEHRVAVKNGEKRSGVDIIVERVE
jgi:hypothetical protein